MILRSRGWALLVGILVGTAARADVPQDLLDAFQRAKQFQDGGNFREAEKLYFEVIRQIPRRSAARSWRNIERPWGFSSAMRRKHRVHRQPAFPPDFQDKR